MTVSVRSQCNYLKKQTAQRMLYPIAFVRYFIYPFRAASVKKRQPYEMHLREKNNANSVKKRLVRKEITLTKTKVNANAITFLFYNFY